MTLPVSNSLQSLAELHKVVREALSSAKEPSFAPEGNVPMLNAKGDVQQPFDRSTHELIRKWLTNQFESGAIHSEENSEIITFGKKPPAYRFIVDPVDGSDNFKRGLALSAVSVAVLRGEEPIGLDQVLFSMVGGLEDPISAQR